MPFANAQICKIRTKSKRKSILKKKSSMDIEPFVKRNSQTEYLIILDINGTLAHSTFQKQPIDHHFKIGKKFVYLRPNVTEFLTFLDQQPRLKVAIWTSCEEQNTIPIVKVLFDQLSPPEFIFTRRECTLQKNYRSIKDLRKVWSAYPQWNVANTIIIDDSAEKVAYQPKNLLSIGTFIANRDSWRDDKLRKTAEHLLKILNGKVIFPCVY